MSLQLAMLERTRTALASVRTALAVEAVQVTTDNGEGVAVSLQRGAVDYGYASNVQERAATLEIAVLASSLTDYEGLLDAAYAAWENFHGELSHGGARWEVRMVRLDSEAKSGGEAAGQLYFGVQSYGVTFVELN